MSKTKIDYTARLQSIENTEQYTLKQLKDKVDYESSIQCFRVLINRQKIPYTRSIRGESNKVLLQKNSEDFAKKTLVQIKKEIKYAGGLDGLNTLLNKYDIKHLPSVSVYPTSEELRSMIKELGDTSNMTPNQILRAIGVEVRNPAQVLIRLNIQYKPKLRKV